MKTRALLTTLTAGTLAAVAALGGAGAAVPAQAATGATGRIASVTQSAVLAARSASSPATAATARTSFPDVTSSNKFSSEISWLGHSGVTTGWPDGTFRPKSAITREAMAAFLYRFAGKPSYKAPATSPFRDVSKSNQFYKEIAWLAATGVSEGWDDHTFRPKSHITREAMAAFLYRYSGKADIAATGGGVRLSDVPKSNQFHKAINWLARTGVTEGWDDHTFRPKSHITREAMAAFLYRYDRGDLPARHFAVKAHMVTPQVLDATNEHRTKKGRAKLAAYRCLADIALHNAEIQADRAKMFHPKNLEQAMSDCDSYGAGENVAYLYSSSAAAVEGWWGSTGHRENMLNKDFAGMAAAVAYDSDGRPYYSQVFSGARH